MEARWAVFFDALRLEWEYEKEGFDFGGGVYYLPDFWLSDVRMWAEVKPETFSEDDLRKAAMLAWKTQRHVLLLDGMPSERAFDFLQYMECNNWGEVGGGIGIAIGEGEAIIQRRDCVISAYHNYPWDEHRFYSDTGGVSARDFQEGGLFDDVPLAVEAARSARFEHGATPKV